MSEFDIKVAEAANAGSDDPRGVAVLSNDIVFTRLLRPEVNDADDFVMAPPAQLAFWLADNWWRVRWECLPPTDRTPAWRLAHELASIGGGYIWPRLAIWGEGERVGLACRSDPPGVVGPVRYVTDALTFISGEAFEKGVDAFLVQASDERVGFGSDRDALRAQIAALTEERADPEMTAWRRLEARLGYDPDRAPEALMQTLSGLVERYGNGGVEEAAQASPGDHAAEILGQEIAAANGSRWTCQFADAIAAAGDVARDANAPPWLEAEAAAIRVRETLGVASGPIRNKNLSELLNVSADAFRTNQVGAGHDLPYGLRLSAARGRGDHVSVRSRWSGDRRFELARALGDAVWAQDGLGPLARSKTARQKFQRAFAQSLLCPFDDLMAYINTDRPTDEDLSAAAKHFHVADKVVQTTLVNKRVLHRDRLEDLVEAA
jgi:hypothetical protein